MCSQYMPDIATYSPTREFIGDPSHRLEDMPVKESRLFEGLWAELLKTRTERDELAGQLKRLTGAAIDEGDNIFIPYDVWKEIMRNEDQP
mgnify:CR=1 FL=1